MTPTCRSPRRFSTSRAAVRVAKVLLLSIALAGIAASGEAELGLADEHRIDQSDAGGAIEAGDLFGFALAVGDFDGDGRADLAIGCPGEAPGAVAGAGAVSVVYGAAAGLGATGAPAPQTLHQDQEGVADVAEAGDGFGFALAVGNFDGDAYDDLAVGVVGEDEGEGAVQVFYGTADGLDPFGDDFLRATDLLGPAPVGSHQMGYSLAAGPYDGDADDDLVIGIPGYSTFSSFPLPSFHEDVGLVVLFDGTIGGVDFDSEPLVWGGEDEGDRFGQSVGIAPVYADGGVSEVLAGSPFMELSGGPTDEGAVWVLGTTLDPYDFGVEAAFFGSSILAADVFGTGAPQLIGGAPGAEVDGQAGAGAVGVLGLGILPFTLFQGGGIAETAEISDEFGAALAAGDFDVDGRADLVVGVPGESQPGLLNAGAVQVLYGRLFALGIQQEQVWTAADFGDPVEPGSGFGAALATGDFDGDGADDLAIGVPYATESGQSSAGAVQIVYGTPPIFLDGFESGDTCAWSLAGCG